MFPPSIRESWKVGGVTEGKFCTERAQSERPERREGGSDEGTNTEIQEGQKMAG